MPASACTALDLPLSEVLREVSDPVAIEETAGDVVASAA